MSKANIIFASIALVLFSSVSLAQSSGFNTVYQRQIKPDQQNPTVSLMLFLMDLTLGGKNILSVGSLCFVDGSCFHSAVNISNNGTSNIAGSNTTVNLFTPNVTISGSAMINVTNISASDGGNILLTFNNRSLENLDKRQSSDNASLISLINTKGSGTVTSISVAFPLTASPNPIVSSGTVSFDNTSYSNLDARQNADNTTIKRQITNKTLGIIVGFSSASFNGNVTNGSLGGYQAGNNICNIEFPGSHFCYETEVFNTIMNGTVYTSPQTFWMIKGAPGYLANANDCRGWTNQSTTYLGAFWDWNSDLAYPSGAGYLTNCAVTKQLGCCR